MKPHYQYSSAIEEDIRRGIGARIFTIDHPLFGSNWVRTSNVVKYDKKTKVIETLNSVYECVGAINE
jgi:hypothetical protein